MPVACDVQDVSDRLENEPAGSPILAYVEQAAAVVVGSAWDQRLPPELLADASQHRRYNYSSLQV